MRTISNTEYETLTNAVVSWAQRRRGIKQKEGILRTVWTQTGKTSRSRFNPAIPSAAWHFDAVKNRHAIQIGAFAPGLAATTPESRLPQAARALYVHECQHALLTERDTTKLAHELHGKGIPFSMLNLFEDARIEAQGRRSPHFTNSFPSGRFNWVQYYEQPDKTDNALRYFWALVNGESESFSSLGVRAPKWTGNPKTLTGKHSVQTINRIFAAACAAPDTRALFPLLEEWVREFGADNKPPGGHVNGNIGGHSDGSGGSKLAGDFATSSISGTAGHAPVETTSGVAPEHTTTEPIDGFVPLAKPGKPSTVGTVRTFQNEAIHRTPRHVANNALRVRTREQINRLANIVRRAAVSPSQTSTSGVRIHLRNAITGQDNAFVRPAKDAGRRKICVVFDCSGSMSTMHHTHGRSFLLSLVALHRAGRIEADVWLTGGNAFCQLNLNSISTRDLMSIAPHHGCESFAGTLAAIPLTNLKRADAVVCYTDGQIGDGHVNAVEYRNKGVNLLGCAVTPGVDDPTDTVSQNNARTIRDALNFHFGRGITKATGAQLASALVTYFTQR